MRTVGLCLLACALALGCSAARNGANGEPVKQEETPLFPGLGKHARPIRTKGDDAQRYFNQGLNFLFAFNHDEAIRSFARAAELDPSCPMPWWGVALANGPHINNPAVPPEREKAAWDALQRAQARLDKATEVERALIAALLTRHQKSPPTDRKALDAAYADAMREVWRQHRDDDDVGALFAESMMDLRPWDLWKADGSPQPGTEEIVATLEEVLRRSPDHPLALHLYIHAVEASPSPERADDAADRLRDLTPGLGHLVHMPSHIDVRRGRWHHAMVANEKAIEADRRYREVRPRQGFYGLYMAHNHHMLAYAAMMTGQSTRAISAIDEMLQAVPRAWAEENAAIADGFMAMPVEVRMRFGRWDEILEMPSPGPKFPLATALWHYARGASLAAKGDPAAARAEQRAFFAARDRVPQEAFFGNNAAADLLAVADHMLEGEILYREGKVDEALAALRRAVQREDALRYDEPPDWILPVRHALGATLLQENRARDAEKVFREDLQKLPGNGWALYGLARSLRLQARDAEATEVETRLARAWADADVKITSSCFCQPGR